MSSPTVCILAAGRGTRMGLIATTLNKALLPLDRKALISHIIQKFPIDTHFVIGVGFLADQVRHYLGMAHPTSDISVVDVDNFEGPGSGPGYSLLCCRKLLQKPFFFVSCDTLWENTLEWQSSYNWLGVARIDPSESASYCNVKVESGLIVDIRDKENVEGPDFMAFVGLCYIKDFSLFWSSLEAERSLAGEHQISNGFRELVSRSELRGQGIDWTDVGDHAKYQRAILRYDRFDFSKPNEAIFFVDGRVIKFFADASITHRRVQRAKLNPEVFPVISSERGQFYAYDLVPGRTLYEVNSPSIFSSLLLWLGKYLWKPANVDKDVFSASCRRFYHDKTAQRIQSFQRKYPNVEQILTVNGRETALLGELLSSFPWSKFDQGIPSFIHGDLQFDNILYDSDHKSFCLLDWRQDFGGNVEFGDLYYDLSKLYGGIILNYDFVKQNLISYEEDGGAVVFDFAQRFQSSRYARILEDFVVERGYDLKKVKLLVGLIYLNMATLHHQPFDKILYYLGRTILDSELRDDFIDRGGLVS